MDKIKEKLKGLKRIRALNRKVGSPEYLDKWLTQEIVKIENYIRWVEG